MISLSWLSRVKVSKQRATYLLVGHVSVDEIVGHGSSLGGSILFAAGQADAMRCHVSVVTSCTEATAKVLHQELPSHTRLEIERSDSDTRFIFGRSPESGPTAVASRASNIASLASGPPQDIIHLAPILGELNPSVFVAARRRRRFVGLTPQGLVREVDSQGKLHLGALPPLCHLPVDVMVVNEGEFTELRNVGAFDGFAGLIFCTLGERGASVYKKGIEVGRCCPAFSATVPKHTIGAGDVFAAAAFVALARGDDPEHALQVAVSVASTFVQRRTPRPEYSQGPHQSPVLPGVPQ